MEGGGIIVLFVIWGFVFWLIGNYWSEIGTSVFGTILGDPLVAEIIDFLW
ncbi:MAG: hypothetical protein AAB405_00215 [Patescibacteria group bacterium]